MKLNTNNIASRYGSVDALNENFTLIEEAVQNTLSRDGTAPNYMEANLDMNSNAIVNCSSVTTNQLILNGVSVTTADTSFTIAGHTTYEDTATAGQTTIDVSPSTIAASSLLFVYVNGIKLRNSEVSWLDNIVTVPALEEDDEVELVEVKVAS